MRGGSGAGEPGRSGENQLRAAEVRATVAIGTGGHGTTITQKLRLSLAPTWQQKQPQVVIGPTCDQQHCVWSYL